MKTFPRAFTRPQQAPTLDEIPKTAHNPPQQRKKRCSGLEACKKPASKAASIAVFLRPRYTLSMGNRGGRLTPAGIGLPVFQPAFVSRPNVWKRSGEPEKSNRQGALMTSTPYIATVAVPVAPTAQDIAADLSPAYWHPLGQFPDEARAKAAVQAFIATHDHDAYFISADPAHPLYQRAIRRLGGAA